MRKASDNSYESIRIYSDYSYIKYQSQENSNLIKIETEIENAMEYAIKIIKKLINVIPLTNPINMIIKPIMIEKIQMIQPKKNIAKLKIRKLIIIRAQIMKGQALALIPQKLQVILLMKEQ